MRERFRPYLNRRFGRRALGAASVGALCSAVAIGFTAIGTLGGQHHYPTVTSKELLAADWNQLRGEMIGQHENSYPSRATLEARLRQIDPSLRLIQPDYAALKRIRGNVAYVNSVSSSAVSLVGRADKGAIVELNASLAQPEESVRYRGHIDLSLWALLAEIEGAVGLLGGAAIVTGEEMKRQRRSRRWKREEVDSWRRLVPSPRFGPLEPQDGFLLVEPQKQDHKDGIYVHATQSRFSAHRPYSGYRVGWSQIDYGWQTPEELQPFTIPHGTPVEQVTERWFEFCGKVADYNAKAWAQTAKERYGEIRAKELIESDEDAQAATALKAEHLPDAGEVIASHGG